MVHTNASIRLLVFHQFIAGIPAYKAHTFLRKRHGSKVVTRKTVYELYEEFTKHPGSRPVIPALVANSWQLPEQEPSSILSLSTTTAPSAHHGDLLGSRGQTEVEDLNAWPLHQHSHSQARVVDPNDTLLEAVILDQHEKFNLPEVVNANDDDDDDDEEEEEWEEEEDDLEKETEQEVEEEEVEEAKVVLSEAQRILVTLSEEQKYSLLLYCYLRGKDEPETANELREAFGQEVFTIRSVYEHFNRFRLGFYTIHTTGLGQLKQEPEG